MNEQLSLFDVDERPSRDPGTVALSELLATHDVVRVHGGSNPFMIVAPHDPERSYGAGIKLRDPGLRQATTNPLQELGYTAPSPFTSWTRRDDNLKLRDQKGTHIYYNMRRQDGAIRASMRLVKTPIQGAHWFVEPWTKDDNTPATDQDRRIATWVENCLFTELNVSWSTLLGDILLMLDYGYMAFEKVFRPGSDGKIHLRKLAPRHPLDIQEWLFDQEGGPNGCLMYTNPYSGPSPMEPYGNNPQVAQGTGMGVSTEPATFIPINKMVVFSHEPEAGDITGISILRSAYKHWYYKDSLYKIDAIQKERHGIGIPIIKLPPGFSDSDKKIADELGRNLRTNERAHVTLPPLWDLVFAKLEGQPVDCMKSIEHHDMRIKSNVLGSFLDHDGGSSDPNIDIFLKSTRYIADYVGDIFNSHIIPQLVDMNWVLGGQRGYPKLRARRIGEWEDLRTLSFAVRNLVAADVIRSDDPLEAHLRREMDLPVADPATSRTPVITRDAQAQVPGAPGDAADTAVTGQDQANIDAEGGKAPNGQSKQNMANNKVGAPRQTKNASMTTNKNAGSDRSGG